MDWVTWVLDVAVVKYAVIATDDGVTHLRERVVDVFSGNRWCQF